MNERMGELLWQAGGYTKLDGSYSLHESHLQKFAELIIKETLQVARAGVEYGPSMEEAVYTYFGVTE
jgi:hypothetical protein